MKSRTILVIFVFGFLSFVIIKAFKNKNDLKNRQDYTIGQAIDTYKGAKDPIPSVEYIYRVSNITYRVAHGFDPKIYQVKKGKKYLMIYSPDNPTNSRMLLKILIHDSIVPPIDGWRNSPFGITDSLDVEW